MPRLSVLLANALPVVYQLERHLLITDCLFCSPAKTTNQPQYCCLFCIYGRDRNARDHASSLTDILGLMEKSFEAASTSSDIEFDIIGRLCGQHQREIWSTT